MSDQTTHLMLPFLQAGQAQKHVTINESLLRLDALVMLAPISASVTAQPASPADGDIYILPAGKTGAQWGGMSNDALAYYSDGAWEQISPREGFVAYVKDVDALKAYDGAAWTAVAGAGAGLASANTFTAAQTIAIAGQTPLTLQTNDDAGAFGPGLSLYRNSASPAAGDDLGQLSFYGRDSAGNIEEYARLRARLQTTTSGAEDGQYDFQTVQGGAVSGRMRVGAGVFHPSATGGDKGNNTLNFGAVYDDNSLLSCYVFDAAFDGKIDEAKWDARVANLKIEAQPRRRAPRMEKRSRQESGIEVVDGVAREVTRDIEFEAPVFDEIPVVDADGNPVMELIEPAGFEPAFDEAGEPMTEEVEEWMRDGKGRRMFDADKKPLTQIVRVQSQKPKPAVMRQKMHRVPVYDWVDATPAEEIERKHDAMRKFKARLGTGTDPLDLDAYVAHMREKRHLTSMPNEEKFDVEKGLPTGAWIQRLVETVEIQAVHIAKLHERLKALGG